VKTKQLIIPLPAGRREQAWRLLNTLRSDQWTFSPKICRHSV